MWVQSIETDCCAGQVHSTDGKGPEDSYKGQGQVSNQLLTGDISEVKEHSVQGYWHRECAKWGAAGNQDWLGGRPYDLDHEESLLQLWYGCAATYPMSLVS
jgi:hypothetical protein